MKAKLLSTSILWASCMLFGGPLAAQTYPTKPINLVVGFAPGGGTDLQARALATAASKHLGQPIVMVNRPGLAGTLGPGTVAETAAPDGYTLAVIPGTLFRVPLLQKVKYDPIKDFTFILKATDFIYGVMVRKDSPFKTLPELITYAKANPGKVTYSAAGLYGTSHMTIERLAKAAGVKFTMVPFNSGMQGYQAAIGGHVDFASDAGFGAMVDGGLLRVLGVFTDSRLPAYPNWPTVKEQGINAEPAKSYWGIGGPKGMDPAIVEKLHAAFKLALDDPDFRAVLTQQSQTVNYLNSADFRELAIRQLREEAADLKALGIKPE